MSEQRCPFYEETPTNSEETNSKEYRTICKAKPTVTQGPNNENKHYQPCTHNPLAFEDCWIFLPHPNENQAA